MTNSESAIRACQLSKAFGGRAVLDGADLEIAAGEVVALRGVNGAGKTTLLGCLASALRPDGGEVFWFGESARSNSARRRLIGLVAHESGLYPHLTLRENLAFAARMSRVDEPGRVVDDWLKTTGLGPYADALPTRLSRGMRQRLAVARALIHDPPILLLDEPFTGLDAAGAEWLLALLADLRGRGWTICFVAHDEEKIGRLAQRVLELHQGKIYDVTATRDERPARRAA